MRRTVLILATALSLGCGRDRLPSHTVHREALRDGARGQAIGVIVRTVDLRQPACAALLERYREEAGPDGIILVDGPDSLPLCSHRIGDTTGPRFAARVVDPVAARCADVQFEGLLHPSAARPSEHAWSDEPDEHCWEGKSGPRCACPR